MTVIITLAGGVVLAAGCLALAWWYLNRLKRQLTDQLLAFITPPDDKTASPFAQMCVAAILAVAPDLATTMAKSVKGMLMGQASSLAKAVDGMEADVAGDALAAGNPMIATLLEFSPSLKKRLLKSPAALAALSSINLGGSKAPSNGQSHGPSSDPFKIG